MRNGQLLAEAPPDAVMKQHNAAVSAHKHAHISYACTIHAKRFG